MQLTVAEYASVHQDGTFTVVRGGIDVWRTRSVPLEFSASLLVEVPPGVLTTGATSLRVSVRDCNGSSVCEIIGNAEIVRSEGVVRAALLIGGKVQVLGPLEIVAAIGVATAKQVVNVVIDDKGQ